MLPLWFVVLSAFVFGTVVGSFVNVLIYRLPLDKSVVSPPSRCPHCDTRLRPADLVPLFSFLALGRKCRYCGAPVSWQYFLIELLVGILFVITVLSFSQVSSAGVLVSGNAVLLCALMAAFVAAFFIDLGHFIIPDSLNYFGITIGVLRAVYPNTLKTSTLWDAPGRLVTPSLMSSIAGAVGLALFLFFITKGGNVLFRRQVEEQQKQWDEKGMLEEGEELEAMGFGDVKLAAAMGANLGLGAGFLALFIGVTLGALVGGAMKLSRRMEGHAIPFGPYLIVGTLAALFFGQPMVAWYVRLMGLE